MMKGEKNKFNRNVFFLLATIIFFYCLLLWAQLENSSGQVEEFSGEQGEPRLFFSDLESGPKIGWEGSSRKGAAVTVWGKGFGNARGLSYIIVNGAKLTDGSDYAEWGAIGPARGLERITFWLNKDCQDGAGTICVNINGATSNKLPFTVRPGNIYFIAQGTGNNRNDGRYSSPLGGREGPWKSLFMIDPGNNRSIKAGDIIYVRDGIYVDDYDEPPFLVVYRGAKGRQGRPISAVGFPSEWPQLGTSDSKGSVIYTETGSGGGNYVEYLEWHKMLWKAGGVSIMMDGAGHIRIIGNRFEEAQKPAQSGLIYADQARNHKIVGNLFFRNGYDKFKHDIYYKAWSERPDVPNSYDIEVAWNEFRETWFNPAVRERDKGGPSLAFSTVGPTAKFLNSQIHDNLWINCADSAILIDSFFKNITIYNNIIANCSSAPGYRPAVYLGDPDDADRSPAGVDNVVRFFNNTLFNSGNRSGMVAIWSTMNKFTLDMKNNIFYSDKGKLVGEISVGSKILSNHDIWYGSQKLPGDGGFKLSSVLSSDPKFLDKSTLNLHVQPGSPAIDSGTPDVSEVVKWDFDGVRRPQPEGSKYDTGAYEYQGKRTH